MRPWRLSLSSELVPRIHLGRSLKPPVDQLNYRDLLRIAFEIGLIQDVSDWFQYREARNQTSHAYDELKAQAVYAVIPAFYVQAQYLTLQLENQLGISS